MRRKSLGVAIAALIPMSAAFAQDSSLLEIVQPYGILKPVLRIEDDGDNKLDIASGSNRIGVRIDEPFIGNIRAFGQGEYSVPVSTGGEVTTRLGYVALKHDWWSLSLGKQWSVYYDVAGYTDYFNFPGGEATGIYTGGTDGGTTGTGRADQALQFRVQPFGLMIGLQAQFRNNKDDDFPSSDTEEYFDTYSASLRYKFNIGPTSLELGGVYHTVEDGASEEADISYDDGIPLQDADAFALGIDFNWNKLRVAFVYADIDKTELADFESGGTPIEADGYELYARYSLNEKWDVTGGFNYLDPDDYDFDGGNGEFELKYGVLGLTRYYAKTSFVTAELVIDDSDASDGGSFRNNTLFLGYYHSFGY